jgi:hypothetical protein
VRDRIRAQLEGVAADVLVSSAACGADLLALDAAGELGIRRVVVLPWDRARFRDRSVIDRGIEWGPGFDRVINDVARCGDLRVVGATGQGNEPYLATNEAILETANDVARSRPSFGDIVALVAWNGQPRGGEDVTEAFLIAARRRGLEVLEIATL